jgi:hypothetical protein
MCGRSSSSKSDSDIAKEFKVEDVLGEEPQPSWNAAPTHTRRVVLEHAPKSPDGKKAAPRVIAQCQLGTGALVGQGREDRYSADQRAQRDGQRRNRRSGPPRRGADSNAAARAGGEAKDATAPEAWAR